MAPRPHPFDPLSAQEISQAAEIARHAFEGKNPNFRFITLREPPKKDMIRFLDEQYGSGTPTFRPTRGARVQIIIRTEQRRNELYELIIDLDQGIVLQKDFLEGKHSYIDSAYMQAVEKVCLANEDVQREIKTLDLPAGATVIVEPWAYATDGMNDMSRRTSMCWFYMRLVDNPDANYYAYPLDICAEVSEELEVTKVYRLPATADERIHQEKRPFDRRTIQPTSDSEYHPSLRPTPRETLKPLHIVQPEGPSFQVNGNHITWEKWSLHVGFNYREGLTLHDIRYDNRSLFYRLSLAEMFVPYGDPRAPYPRKAAFDLGNDGAGINANNLQLGCDCLGVIKYFDAWHNTPSGAPLKLPNVVCCHEQDDGILWKHTNFRTQNAVVARSRILVLQTIITVSNYEYIFAFHFSQDASITYEVRATGIVSTVPIAHNTTVPYGTTVAPGILAPYHQHLFCLRIDPSLETPHNSLLVTDTHPLPPSPTTNPFAIGYTSTSYIPTHETHLDLSPFTSRTFTLINESHPNPHSQSPIGYKLHPHTSQLLLAHPSSYHARRAQFATHALWLTRYHDDELFPAGRHTMQSLGVGADGGIASLIAARAGTEEAEVRDRDIVLWHTFGSTHAPRVEDWPVMPVEKMSVGLRPVGFFKGSPALDVRTQARGDGVGVGSVLFKDEGEETKEAATVGGGADGAAGGCRCVDEGTEQQAKL